jgi:methylated-DNA-[protein]-cysteine S-methyltransferase
VNKNRQYIYQSPFGKLNIITAQNQLIELKWSKTIKSATTANDILSKKIYRYLDHYFAYGEAKLDFKLNLIGTEFQLSVWQQLLKIPSGKVMSYLEVAKKINRMKSFRAVANACGKNPIVIIIPCHRVIKNDGDIGGYTSAINAKNQLIEFERLMTGDSTSFR